MKIIRPTIGVKNTDRDRQLTRAMLEHGYRVAYRGEYLQLLTVRTRWAEPRLLPRRYRSLQEAAESLIPIISDDDYTNRVITRV